jgi:hypothetical protein
LAYLLGWMTHLVGDGLIKSVWPGLKLHLLDGKYTAKNRPVQDLFTYHEVGRKELRLDWPALLADMAETPVEPVQLHYMRVASPRGRLARDFPDGWMPADAKLLQAVLVENRRYFAIHKDRVLESMRLRRIGNQWQCREDLQRATGGLNYAQLIEAAERSNLRHALWQIAEAIADLFSDVAFLVPALRRIHSSDKPSWAELTERWKPS